MSNRFPEPADPFEEQGQSSQDADSPEQIMTGDTGEEPVVPGEYPIAVDDYGTTDEEQSHNEPFDGKLRREEPDLIDLADTEDADTTYDTGDETADPFPDADERVGRLVAPDEGSHEVEEKDEIAFSVGTDSGGFSPEERAMHIEPER